MPKALRGEHGFHKFLACACAASNSPLISYPPPMLPLHGSDRDWLDPPPASSKGRWLSRFAAVSALFLSVHALLRLYSHATTVVTPPPYQAPSIPNEPAYPPTYSDYHRAELQLPQHHWDQTHPAGGEKFFFVAGHTKGQHARMFLHLCLAHYSMLQGLGGETLCKSTC